MVGALGEAGAVEVVAALQLAAVAAVGHVIQADGARLTGLHIPQVHIAQLLAIVDMLAVIGAFEATLGDVATAGLISCQDIEAATVAGVGAVA